MNLNWPRITTCIAIYGICATFFYLLLVSADAKPTANGHPLSFILFVAPALNRLRGPSDTRSSHSTQLVGLLGMFLISLVPFVAAWFWPEKIIARTHGVLGCSAACILVYGLDCIFEYVGRRVGNTKAAG